MGSTEIMSVTKKSNETNDVSDVYGPNLKILPCNNQVKELQTILRDKNTTRSDFKFYADRLIRLVIEESLNQLPFSKCVVTTPTGAKYNGLKYQKGNCGVSIVRSGEAMEQGLRDCCRSIRIGKILVESDVDTHEAKVVYAKFPDDISERKVLLMYPIMSTGNTVIKAIAILKEHNVLEENIILSNLFCTPIAAKSLVTAFPQMPTKVGARNDGSLRDAGYIRHWYTQVISWMPDISGAGTERVKGDISHLAQFDCEEFLVNFVKSITRIHACSTVAAGQQKSVCKLSYVCKLRMQLNPFSETKFPFTDEDIDIGDS